MLARPRQRSTPRQPSDRMTVEGFTAKWTEEAERLEHRHALVAGGALLDEVLRDFAEAIADRGSELLNLTVAAHESGYSADHLGRLVKGGVIPNAGRPHAPRIRRADLPRRAGALPPGAPGGNLVGATPRQVARAIITSAEDG